MEEGSTYVKKVSNFELKKRKKREGKGKKAHVEGKAFSLSSVKFKPR